MIASCTKQHCVTLSTSEAKYVALAQGAKTALFTKAVLAFLQPQLVGRHRIIGGRGAGGYNQHAENPISEERTKSIDVRYHFIRELGKRKGSAIKHTEPRDQCADIRTKQIGAEGFVRHRCFLVVLSGSFFLSLPRLGWM